MKKKFFKIGQNFLVEIDFQSWVLDLGEKSRSQSASCPAKGKGRKVLPAREAACVQYQLEFHVTQGPARKVIVLRGYFELCVPSVQG